MSFDVLGTRTHLDSELTSGSPLNLKSHLADLPRMSTADFGHEISYTGFFSPVQDKPMKVQVVGIEMFHKTLDEGQARRADEGSCGGCV